MPKKLFSWTTSSKKSDKLVTDAVVLEENNVNSNVSANDSPERAQSNSLSISPLSPEMGSRNFDYQNMALMRPNDLLAEPSSSALSVSNSQQNFYQFSHINGLHIGSSVQITHNVQSSEQSSERRSATGETIPKTRSIDGES